MRPGCIKSLIIIFFLAQSMNSAAPGVSAAFIPAAERVDPYNRIIDAVVMVESSGNYCAINIAEEAYGAFQIRPIRLMDYYQRTGKTYTTVDCFSYNVSKEIFLYYARLIGFNDYQTIARSWNGSGRMTLDYWEKVKKYL